MQLACHASAVLLCAAAAGVVAWHQGAVALGVLEAAVLVAAVLAA